MSEELLAAQVVAVEDKEFYLIDRSLFSNGPLKTALELVVQRQGVPLNKFAWRSLPLQDDKRVCVVIMLFPPEHLRDQPIHVVQEHVDQHSRALLTGMANEIYKGFTSEAISPTAAQNIATALTQHAVAPAKRAKCYAKFTTAAHEILSCIHEGAHRTHEGFTPTGVKYQWG